MKPTLWVKVTLLSVGAEGHVSVEAYFLAINRLTSDGAKKVLVGHTRDSCCMIVNKCFTNHVTTVFL